MIDTILETDSVEYDILFRAALASTAATGASCEIGVREGGASELILRATHINKSSRLHIAVDPWDSDAYPTLMRRRTTLRLSMMADAMNLDLLILPWEDTDFFARCADGVPFYQGDDAGRLESTVRKLARQVLNVRGELVTEYSFVHIDADHTVPAVQRAIDFFATRTSLGGCWVFDDIHSYVDTPMLDCLESLGFTVVERGANRLSVRKDK